jgi:hypothetical protein
MKKPILGILFGFLFSQQAQSQSFTVVAEELTILENDPFELRESPAIVKNISSSNKRVLVSREVISLFPSHSNYFCWGINCYGPVTSQSPDTLTLAPNEENGSFKGYINPNGADGVSKINYCFINADNTADRVCFTVDYLFGIAALEPRTSGGGSRDVPAVPASYDPYNQTIKVSVNGGKIDTMNMLGQSVELNFKYDGSGMIADASRLKTGYYFLFGSNERGPWGARVIVTK